MRYRTASETQENSVKAILELAAASKRRVATTGRLARRLGISDGTASKLIRSLAEAGLVEFAPYGGARLTERGEALARRVLSRHRLVAAFLTSVLDLEPHEAHDEAERLEHAVSDALAARMESVLASGRTAPRSKVTARSHRLARQRSRARL
jgi:DtxR family Mn-dependent transcriptional regulator